MNLTAMWNRLKTRLRRLPEPPAKAPQPRLLTRVKQAVASVLPKEKKRPYKWRFHVNLTPWDPNPLYCEVGCTAWTRGEARGIVKRILNNGKRPRCRLPIGTFIERVPHQFL